MGEEDSGSLQTLLAQGLLAASGFQGLEAANRGGLQFAGPAFSVSLFAGCVGVLQNITGNDLLTKVNKYTSAMCRTFVVPLVASEVCLKRGIKMELALLNLAYPTLHYICTHVIDDQDFIKNEYLELSQTISIATVSYFYFLDSHEWGIIMSVVYALAALGSNFISTIESSIAMLAIGNFINALKVL